MARTEKVILKRDEDGQIIREPVKGYVNYAEPQADENGEVPEFCNVTGKQQNMCVPNDPHGTLFVAPWGVLKGAQWRDPYATPEAKWLKPPFRERVRDKKGDLDPKYVLTTEQAVEEIANLNYTELDALTRVKKRVRSLVDNMVFDDDDPDRGPRRMDDRHDVLAASDRKIRQIEEAAEKDRKAQGL